jgi:general stress protein 26
VASWFEVEASAPELAAQARRRFEAHKQHTLATLRRDGSPRISGMEIQFLEGELWIGSMFDALKARDLRRDPRFALHSQSEDPPAWPGDAKLAGRAIEVTDPATVERINGSEVGPSHLFRADVTEVVLVHLNEAGDKLVLEAWHEGRGLSRMER